MSPIFKAKPSSRIWKDIPGCPGYQISVRGQVRNPQRKPLKTFLASGGMMITITCGGDKTTFRIARLVGAAFCDDYAGDLYPMYLNGRKTDCRARNLRWVTRSEIMKGTRKK